MKELLFTNSNIDMLFENCFSMPPYSRIEFLALSQTNSGYSEKTFLNLLLSRWKDYRSQVFSEYIKLGFDEVNRVYGFEFCLKIWGDEPEDFEYYDYTNSDGVAILNYSCFEDDKALSKFIKNTQDEVNWLNEDVLFLIRDYIYKLYNHFEENNLQSDSLPKGQSKLIQSNDSNVLIKRFNSLVNDYFSVETLIRQIDEFTTLRDKIVYIEYIIDNFNSISLRMWLQILEKQNQFNVKYGTPEFYNATGTFGLYIDNPDEMPFSHTTLGMKLELILNDFIRRCELLKLKINEAYTQSNNTIHNLSFISFNAESLEERDSIKTFKVNPTLIADIHDECNNDIFICHESDFIKCIQSANFSQLKIKTKSKVKLLIYYLSNHMGSVWYEETAKSLGYKKSDCSGANVSDLKWKNKLKRIIAQ